jgi:hypothetical protein
MTNDLLEKMAYLHECGFEPDYVDCGAGMLCPYSPDEPWDKDLDAAWFSESRLWSLLPHCINDYELHANENCLSYDNYIGEALWGTLYTEFIETTLHSALLDLVIWCVKEGHLKAEVKHD